MPPRSKRQRARLIGFYGLHELFKYDLIKQIQDECSELENIHYFNFAGQMISHTTSTDAKHVSTPDCDQQTAICKEGLAKVWECCKNTGTIGVITGNMMPWEDEHTEEPRRVDTDIDWIMYTHIIYLHDEGKANADRWKSDDGQIRKNPTAEHLKTSQRAEVDHLRKICLEHKILLAMVAIENENWLERIGNLIEDFHINSEEQNLRKIAREMRDLLGCSPSLETVLGFDGDGTLASTDTDKSLLKELDDRQLADELENLFRTQRHSYFACRQAELLSEEHPEQFSDCRSRVAAMTKMHPEMQQLFGRVNFGSRHSIIVVAPGFQEIWSAVLGRHRVRTAWTMQGGSSKNNCVVTGATKRHIIKELHSKDICVIAFGDSPLDVKMLCEVDRSYVTVGSENQRRTIMEAKLDRVLEDSTNFHQVLLPGSRSTRLNLSLLPEVRLDDVEEIEKILRPNRIMLAPDSAAIKLLLSPLRDANISDPEHRLAHENIGRFIALTILADTIGLESYLIDLMESGFTEGYRFVNELHTLILPLTPNGQLMAIGISAAMPNASFVLDNCLEDGDESNFENMNTIILVESSVSSGEVFGEPFKSLRRLVPSVHIFLVTAIIQDDTVQMGGGFRKSLRFDDNLWLVALRKENSYVRKVKSDKREREYQITFL